jgi:hypothetical protein
MIIWLYFSAVGANKTGYGCDSSDGVACTSLAGVVAFGIIE